MSDGAGASGGGRGRTGEERPNKRPTPDTLTDAQTHTHHKVVHIKVQFNSSLGTLYSTLVQQHSNQYFTKEQTADILLQKGGLFHQPVCYIKACHGLNGDTAKFEVPLYQQGAPGRPHRPDHLLHVQTAHMKPHFVIDDQGDYHWRHPLEGPELVGTVLEVPEEDLQLFFYASDVMLGIEKEMNIPMSEQAVAADGTMSLWPRFSRIFLNLNELKLDHTDKERPDVAYVCVTVCPNPEPLFRAYSPQYLHVSDEGSTITMKTNDELKEQTGFYRALRVQPSYTDGPCHTLAHTIALTDVCLSHWSKRFFVFKINHPGQPLPFRELHHVQICALAVSKDMKHNPEHSIVGAGLDRFAVGGGLNTNVASPDNHRNHVLNLDFVEHAGRQTVTTGLCGGRRQWGVGGTQAQCFRFGDIEWHRHVTGDAKVDARLRLFSVIALFVEAHGGLRYFVGLKRREDLKDLNGRQGAWTSAVANEDNELEPDVTWREFCEGFPRYSILPVQDRLLEQERAQARAQHTAGPNIDADVPAEEKVLIGVQLQHPGASVSFLRPAVGHEHFPEPPSAVSGPNGVFGTLKTFGINMDRVS